MPELILASTSPYRRQALERLGLQFTACPPDVDEEALKDPDMDGETLAKHLAHAKAKSIAQRFPSATVIGSDQLADHHGRILGKPGSTAAACAQLQSLSNSSHRLITAIEVISPQQTLSHCDITTLTMRTLNAEAIQRYVEHDTPLDCAGAYRIEGAGISLFSRIVSEDHSAITGMPLIALVSMLIQLGHTIP